MKNSSFSRIFLPPILTTCCWKFRSHGEQPRLGEQGFIPPPAISWGSGPSQSTGVLKFALHAISKSVVSQLLDGERNTYRFKERPHQLAPSQFSQYREYAAASEKPPEESRVHRVNPDRAAVARLNKAAWSLRTLLPVLARRDKLTCLNLQRSLFLKTSTLLQHS